MDSSWGALRVAEPVWGEGRPRQASQKRHLAGPERLMKLAVWRGRGEEQRGGCEAQPNTADEGQQAGSGYALGPVRPGQDGLTRVDVQAGLQKEGWEVAWRSRPQAAGRLCPGVVLLTTSALEACPDHLDKGS